MAQRRDIVRAPLLPRSLPIPLRGAGRSIRAAWFTLLVAVALIQLAGLCYVLFDTFRVNPAFRAVGIAMEFDDDDRPVIRPLRADIVAAGAHFGDRIVSISRTSFGPDASAFTLARAILAAPGDVVTIGLRSSDGRLISVRASRSSRAALVVPPNPISLSVRTTVRLFFTLLSSLALLGSSLVLLLRRPHDPVAFLLGIGFLGAAASVDPPLLMWLSIGAGWMINALTGLWWTALVIALAAFPDGRFTPAWSRWSLIAAPVLGLILAVDEAHALLTLFIGITVPLLLVAAQVVRYRSLEPGLKRQQIKWAALGFAAGFILLGLALGMALAPYEDWTATQRAVWLLSTVCLFNLGFALMPLGLLIAMIRFRLWDVDQVITRSVAYTLLTSGIALLWALLSDVAKQGVSMLLGQDHAMLGLGLGAIVAAAVFGPSQRALVQWSKRRFDKPRVDLERLPARLSVWRERCDAAQIATRALDVAMRALHAPAGVVFARAPTGRTMLAIRNLSTTEADAMPERIEAAASGGAHVVDLEDDDGLAGWLILLPREDGSRFPKSAINALASAAAPLAEALRAAVPAVRREAAVLGLLDEMQQRLARLEESRPRPA